MLLAVLSAYVVCTHWLWPMTLGYSIWRLTTSTMYVTTSRGRFDLRLNVLWRDQCRQICGVRSKFCTRLSTGQPACAHQARIVVRSWRCSQGSVCVYERDIAAREGRG